MIERRLRADPASSSFDGQCQTGQDTLANSCAVPPPEQFEAEARRTILAERLHRIGVLPEKAKAMIESYEEGRIRNQVLFMPHRDGIRSPGALMVKAVADNFPPPSTDFDFRRTLDFEIGQWQASVRKRQIELFVAAMKPHADRFRSENAERVHTGRRKWIEKRTAEAKRSSLTFRPERNELDFELQLALNVHRSVMEVDNPRGKTG